MVEKDYYNIFNILDIKVEPLSVNYSPEQYGKRLMADCQSASGVSYSAGTDPSSNIKTNY